MACGYRIVVIQHFESKDYNRIRVFPLIAG